MKNDEKIDIILSEDLSGEELTQEELIQANYDTAMRYIGIAEHMKKFEEQDKYYQRAIASLKKVNDDKRFADKIRELNFIKFKCRAEGKIQLYEEACRIRDNAKTPQDYYSAQAVFLRIAKYEPNHPIHEKFTAPDVYARAMQCTDSEEQAKYCEKMALLQEKADRRHSLIASISLIVAILAVVIFSRTTMARRVLAYGYNLMGNYTGAYQKYNAVYERTGEKEAYLSYLEARYNAAKKNLANGETELAYEDFKAVALPKSGFGYDDGYKDSRQQFTLMEIENLKSVGLSEVAHYARMDWRVLAIDKDRILLGKDSAISSTPFDLSGDHPTWDSSYIRNWLNSTFLEENFFDEEISMICDTEVVTEENPIYPGVDPGETTTDKVFLLSIGEVTKYYNELHPTQTYWWLRTPGANKGTMAFVNRNKEVMPYGYEITDTSLSVKPAMWVSLK